MNIKIIDNFLSSKELKKIQVLCLADSLSLQEFPKRGVLLEKCSKIARGGECISAMLYRVPADTTANPHRDGQPHSTVFYPFDSDGPLGIWNDDWKLKELIQIKENRLVSWDSVDLIHSQQPPSKGVRYSVALHWSASS